MEKDNQEYNIGVLDIYGFEIFQVKAYRSIRTLCSGKTASPFVGRKTAVLEQFLDLFRGPKPEAEALSLSTGSGQLA